jgi:hypothetical protein
MKLRGFAIQIWVALFYGILIPKCHTCLVLRELQHVSIKYLRQNINIVACWG